LGLGDLMFVALVLATLRAHGRPVGAAFAACIAGTALAGLASALSGAAVPALVAVGAAGGAFVPGARRLRPEDRRTTVVGAVVAGGVVLGVLLRRFAGGS